MIKIRLMRIGVKKRPFYRVVVVDEQAKRTGAYIELLGTYNPLTTPKDIILKQDRIDHWIKQGAQMSEGFLRIIGKAKQRPPRKAKKEQKKEPTPAPAAPTEEAPETPASAEIEAPAESAIPEETKAEETNVEQLESPETPTEAAPATPTEEKTNTDESEKKNRPNEGSA